MSDLKCNKCKTPDEKLRRCAVCLAVCYCSRECQFDHWKSVHKNECKLMQIDKILRALSDDEGTGFMELKAMDQRIVQSNLFPGIGPKQLPDVMSFINPLRYLKSIIEINEEIINEMKRQCAKNSFDTAPFRKVDLSIKHVSICSQIFGIMQFLAMCSKLNNYMAFYAESVEGNTEIKYVFDDFVNRSNCKFDILFVFMGLSQYVLQGQRVHYFTVIRMNNKYRLIQSFGLEYGLKQMLDAKCWVNKDEIIKILDGFLQLEKVGLDQKITATDLVIIKETSKLCLGFELAVDPNAPRRNEEQMMQAVVLKDLSFKHFKAASQHLLDFMDYFLDKIEKRELGSMIADADLRFRMGYPVCLNQEALKSMARKWPSRYPNYL